mgnify:CR=1 FL=1
MNFGVHVDRGDGDLVELVAGLSIEQATRLGRKAKDAEPNLSVFVTWKDKETYRRFVEVAP